MGRRRAKSSWLRSLLPPRHPQRRRSASSLRIGFAAGLTLVVLISLGFVGGMGYASSGLSHVVNAIAQIAHVQKPKYTKPSSVMSAAGSQYGGAVAPQTPAGTAKT